jgi:hypothetical protein
MACKVTAVALALALTACAVETIGPDVPKVVSHAIAPYEQHEECVDLREGDRLDYRFEAQMPVAFSIRYLDGSTIVMPISRDAVQEDGGIFQPRLANRYCLHWDAGQRGAIIDYRIRLLQRTP